MSDTIFELRDYLLIPGQRDTLIDLFEREFVESQEAVGAGVVATFRDIDAPDHFVWLRSFANMDARAAALTAFYTGPVWREHREAARATMIDSSHVHLLHSVGEPLRLPAERPPIGTPSDSATLIAVDVYPQRDRPEEELDAHARRDNRVIATFATERSANNFPTLPVQEEIVFVTLRGLRSIGGYSSLAGLPAPRRTLLLRPTARSRLR